MTEQNKEEMITVSKTRLEKYIHSANLGCGYGNMNCAMPDLPECSNTDCFYCKYSRLNYDEDLSEATINWLKEEENA